MNIDTIIFNQRLYIDNHYEDLAKSFCNLAGQGETRTKERFILRNWYEGYIYTLLLGLRTGNREKTINRGEKAPKWSPNYDTQFKYAIAILLTKKDILKELNLLEYDDLINNYIYIEDTIKRIKKICDEYSNGGLKYLSEQYANDDSIFDDYDCLKTIMETVIENKNAK